MEARIFDEHNLTLDVKKLVPTLWRINGMPFKVLVKTAYNNLKESGRVSAFSTSQLALVAYDSVVGVAFCGDRKMQPDRKLEALENHFVGWVVRREEEISEPVYSMYDPSRNDGEFCFVVSEAEQAEAQELARGYVEVGPMLHEGETYFAYLCRNPN